MSIEIERHRPSVLLTRELDTSTEVEMFGGKPEKWIDGIYYGDVRLQEDRQVFIKAVVAGELAVADFGPTYGVVGNSYNSEVWEKILRAKGARPGKPLSMLATPDYLPCVLDLDEIHEPGLRAVLSDPKQIEARFGGLTFLKVPVNPGDVEDSFLALYYGPDGTCYQTANILPMPKGFPLFDEYRDAASQVEGIPSKYVTLRVSSCNLSGRGLEGYENNPMYVEITDVVHANQFAQLAGGLVRVVLHDYEKHLLDGDSSMQNDHRRGSFPIVTVRQKDVILTRQGNIPDHHVGYLHWGLPFVLENSDIIRRNHRLSEKLNEDEYLRFLVDNNGSVVTGEGVVKAVRYHITRRLS
mgnify:CR=1 FL=1